MKATTEPSTGLPIETPERAAKIDAIRKRAKARVQAAYRAFMKCPTEGNLKELDLMLAHYQGSHPINDVVLVDGKRTKRGPQ